MTQISQNLAGLPGVRLGAHRCGGIGIFVEGQERGQLQHSGLLDVSLIAAQRDVLLKGDPFHRHHTFPDSDWITVPITGSPSVPLAVNALAMTHARVLDAAFPGQGVTLCASPMAHDLIT